MKRVTAHIKFNGKTIHKVRTVTDTDEDMQAMGKAEIFFDSKLKVDIIGIEDTESEIKYWPDIKQWIADLIVYDPNIPNDRIQYLDLLIKLPDFKELIIELSETIKQGEQNGMTKEQSLGFSKALIKRMIDSEDFVKN